MEKNLEDSKEETKTIYLTEDMREKKTTMVTVDIRNMFHPDAGKLKGLIMGREEEQVVLFAGLEVLTAQHYLDTKDFAQFYYKRTRQDAKTPSERWGRWLFEVRLQDERLTQFSNWGMAMLFEWINYKGLINYYTDLLKNEKFYGKTIVQEISKYFIQSIQGNFYSITSYEKVSKAILEYAKTSGIEIEDTLSGRYLFDYPWLQWGLPSLEKLEEGYALVMKGSSKVGFLMNPGKTIQENMKLSIENADNMISSKELKPDALFQANARAQRDEYNDYQKPNITLDQIGTNEGALYAFYSSKLANIGNVAIELDRRYFKLETITAIIAVSNFSKIRLEFRLGEVSYDNFMNSWLNRGRIEQIDEIKVVKTDLENKNDAMMIIIAELKEAEEELDKIREESLELNFRGSVPRLTADRQVQIYEKRIYDMVHRYEETLPQFSNEVKQNRDRKEAMKAKIIAKREELIKLSNEVKETIIDLPKQQKSAAIAPTLLEIKATTDLADIEEIAEEKPKDDETVYLPEVEAKEEQEEIKDALHQRFDPEIARMEAGPTILESPPKTPEMNFGFEEEDKDQEENVVPITLAPMVAVLPTATLTDDEAIDMYERLIALPNKFVIDIVVLENYLRQNWGASRDHPLWAKIKRLKASLREQESDLPEPDKARKQRKTEGRNEFVIMDRDIRGIVAGGEKRGEIIEAFKNKRERKKMTKAERNLLYSESIRFAVQAAVLTRGKEQLIRQIIKNNYMRIYKGGKEEEPEIDLRPYTRFTDIYDLVEIPPINIGLLDKKALWDVADVLGDMGFLYYNPEKKVGIEYVYYIYKKGELTYIEDGAGRKKWHGAAGGGSLLLYLAKDDTAMKFKSLVHEALMHLVDNYSKGEIYGSGQVKINVLLQNRALYKEGEKADLFLQYMKVRKTDELNPDLLYELKAFSSNLSQVHSAVRKMTSFGSKVKNGLCLFEAYLIVKEGGKRIGIEWKEHVYGEFLVASSVYKSLVVSGSMVEFLNLIFSVEKINIPLYNAANHTMFAPDENSPFTKYCMIYYASHVYVGTLEKICNQLGVSGDNKFLAIQKYSRQEKFKECLPYRMSRAPEIDKEKPEDNKSQTVKNIHWSLDYETYSTDEKGYQEPYLLVVKRHGDYEANVYQGPGCTIDFIFDILVPIIVEKKKGELNHFWTYNGANFDFHFLIRGLQLLFQLQLFGSETSIKTLKLDNGIDFLDLACWYNVPFDKDHENKGLGALARKCKTKFQKTSFNHAVTKEMLKDEKFCTEAVKYCKNDVYVLEELVELLVVGLYETFSYKERPACRPAAKNYPHSSASLATTMFKNCFLPKGEELKASPLNIYEKERRSYHGGLTIAFKMVSGKVRVFDINSSYPWVMTQPMPYRYISTWLNSSKQKVNKKDIIDTCLYGISAFDFPDDIFLPCLMVKTTDGSLAQVKHYKAESKDGYIYAWGIEVKEAFKLGAKIVIEEIHEYTSVCVFEEYVKFFYAKKSEAKANKDIVKEIFYKNLLNSLQGKLGQRNQDTKSFGLIHMLANEIFQRGFENVREIEYVRSGVYKIVWKDEADGINKVGSLVRFPSYIAAYGRIKLVQGIYSVDTQKVVYCDTDSIMLEDNCSLPPELISETELGLFKEELDKKCDVGMFFGAKNYVLIKANNAKIHCKGARTFDDPKKYCDALLNGEKIVSEINPVFVKRFGEVYVTKIKRELSNTIAMKRIIVSDKETRCFENIAEHAAAIEKINSITKAKEKRTESVTRLIHKEVKERMLNTFNAIVKDQEKGKDLESYFEEAKIPLDIKRSLVKIVGEKAELEEKLSELLLNASLLYDPNKILELRNAIMDIDKNADEEITKLADILTNERV